MGGGMHWLTIRLTDFSSVNYLSKTVIFIMTSRNYDITSVIRQKGESQNGYFKKTRHAKLNNEHFLLLACFVSLKHPF